MPDSARVIRILDEHRVVLNVGSNDGISRGDEFAIYTPEEEITDPATGESLGTYRERKARVRADIVRERFTIASPPATYTWNVLPGIGNLDAAKFQPKLPVRSRDIEQLPTGSTVTVGDVAVRLRPPEPAPPPKPSPEGGSAAENASPEPAAEDASPPPAEGSG